MSLGVQEKALPTSFVKEPRVFTLQISNSDCKLIILGGEYERDFFMRHLLKNTVILHTVFIPYTIQKTTGNGLFYQNLIS